LTIHYVDPVRGADANPGTADKPWKTLAEVLGPATKKLSTRFYDVGNPHGVTPYGETPAAGAVLKAKNPTGPIKPGDTIKLRSGDHGVVELRAAYNEDVIRVVPDSGAEPVLGGLVINGAAKWAFEDGIKVRNLKAAVPRQIYLVEIGRSSWFGYAEDIIVSKLLACGGEDYRAWTDQQWIDGPIGAIGALGWSRRVQLVGNEVYACRNAIAAFGRGARVEANLVRDNSNDSVNFGASDVVIRQNLIKEGRNSPKDAFHADGMQGWEPAGHGVVRNVLIERNSITKYGRSKARTTDDPTVSYQQGICIFDGRWDGVKIIDNSVVTNSYHAIAAYGVDHLLVARNTVLATHPGAVDPWIGVFKGKDGRVPVNNVLRDNTCPVLSAAFEGVVREHNRVAKRIAWQQNGKPVYLTAPGLHGSDRIDPLFGTLITA